MRINAASFVCLLIVLGIAGGAVAEGVSPARALVATVDEAGTAIDAVDDQFVVDVTKSSTLTVPAPGLLANDTSTGGGLSVTGADSTGLKGTLVLGGAGGGFTFTPSSRFTGQTTFRYEVTDALNNVDIARVTITVTATLEPRDDQYVIDLAGNGSVDEAAPGFLRNDRRPSRSTFFMVGTSPDFDTFVTAFGTTSGGALAGVGLQPGTAFFDYKLSYGSLVSQTTARVSIVVIDSRLQTATPTATPTEGPPPATVTPTVVPPTATPRPGFPTAALSSSRGTVNSPVGFTISGFVPNQDVAIKWRRLSGSFTDVLTVRTNSNGGATGSFRVPATPGGPGQEVHFIQGAITKIVPFEIRARIKIAPDPAARGETIDISLRGYSRTETVRIRWLLDGKFELIASVQTSNTGSANLKIPVPAFIPDGDHSVRGDGTLFRQQTNTVTILGGIPFAPQASAAEDQSSPTATPTPTATPAMTATESPAPDPTVEATEEITPVPSPELTPESTVPPEVTAEATVEVTAAPEPSPETELTPVPGVPGETVTPESTRVD